MSDHEEVFNPDCLSLAFYLLSFYYAFNSQRRGPTRQRAVKSYSSISYVCLRKTCTELAVCDIKEVNHRLNALPNKHMWAIYFSNFSNARKVTKKKLIRRGRVCLSVSEKMKCWRESHEELKALRRCLNAGIQLEEWTDGVSDCGFIGGCIKV